MIWNCARTIKFCLFLALILIINIAPKTAFAACNAGTVTEPELVNTSGDYDPFSISAQTNTWSVTIENTSSGSGTLDCTYIVSFHRTDPGNPEFTAGLSYTLSGSLEYFATSAAPTISGALISSTLAFGGQETVQFTTQIASGQVVAAGQQTDNITVRLYELDTSTNPQTVGTKFDEHNAAPISTTVAQSCLLPAPDTSLLDFSAAISNALPDGVTIKTAVFNNVACTAAAKITLSGDAMRPSNGASAISGYDNFINYQATGTFDSANVELTTNEDSGSESSTSADSSNGVTTTGTLTVEVILLPNNPILAGAYTDILTIEVMPTP